MRSSPRAAWPIYLLILLIIAPCTTAWADGDIAPLDGKDFRQASWGQTRQQVRASESSKPHLDDGPLMAFPATVANHPCQVLYLFRDNKLCMGFFQFSDIDANLNSYFTAATLLRKELVEAWEEPQVEKWDWEDPMFAEDPELRAEALGLGLVNYEVGWMIDRSIAALRMSGGNLKADIVVMLADRTSFPAGQDVFGEFFANTVGVPSPYYR